MKKSILLVLSICALGIQIGQAQVGLNLGYKHLSVPLWNDNIEGGLELAEGSNPFSTGFHVGVDYWFRLKEYRVEFLPQLSFSRFGFEQTDTENIQHQFSSSFTSISFPTNFYLFDFKGDCNCPTFSKQGPSLAKGFFLQLSPGLSYMQNSAATQTNREIGLNESKQEAVVFNIGLGIGLDIGISDFLTITPMLRYHYYLPQKWDSLVSYLNPFADIPPAESSNISQVFAGIRIGLRFDELNK